MIFLMFSTSMERFLLRQLAVVNLIIIVLLISLLWALSISLLLSSFVLLLTLILLGYLSHSHYQTVMSSYTTVYHHLDAIVNDDYKIRAHQTYQQGTVAQIQCKLKELSEFLHAKKNIYDKSIYLMYSLIEQLDTPVLMLNQRGQLIRANDAFSRFYGQSWHLLRKYNATQLGLLKKEKLWQLSDNDKNSRWEIRQSYFRTEDEIYELLVMIDLEATIRKTQQESWQKIIRVLSHEINNSLTPIQSLAQSISDNEPVSTSGKKVLNIIYERSMSLQKFINEYVKCSKPQQPQYKKISIDTMFNNIAPLFINDKQNRENLRLTGTTLELWVDPMLIEQVLINLIKNAFEACNDNPQVSVDCSLSGNKVIIKIIDNGHGIQNPDNIMTPFYTTKANGQGLGLDICRNLIESHKGRLVLQKRKSAQGTEAIITLPVLQPSESSQKP